MRRYNPKIPKRTSFELNALKFIAEGDNAILIGPPGTGKSHLAKAIAYSAVRSGLRVLYTEADELLEALVQTRAWSTNARREDCLEFNEAKGRRPDDSGAHSGLTIENYVTALQCSTLTPAPLPSGEGSVERIRIIIRFRKDQ